MKVVVNNQTMDIDDQATLACVVKQFAAQGQFAVAHNGRFVSKQHYQTTQLTLADKIEILSPIQGG